MRRPVRFPVLALLTATSLALGIPGLAPVDARAESLRPERKLDNPVDRDGDGELGEADAIRQRVRAYLERHGDHGVITPQENLRKARWAYKRSLQQRGDAHTESISGDGWVSLGPNNGAGRFTAIAPHPSVTGTLLAGAAGGGVWRTNDGGQTWVPLTDGIPDLSVGAVAYAPSDPNVVYLGTGEGGYAIDFIPGIGLLRSEDGGDTWILPEQVVATNFYRISVDPRDPDILVCGTNQGLIRSVDGGVTWSVPIPRNPGGGGTSLVVTDVARGHAEPDLIYASVWCLDESCPAGIARVMRSSDNGVTWTPAATGLPSPDSDWGRNRLGLALAPGSDAVLYAATNIAGDDGGAPPARVYRTSNGGQSWTATTKPPAYLGAQGWYDNAITVSPSSTDLVVAGGVWYVRSTTGGSGWLEQNPYEQTGLPHVDVHDLQWQGSTLWVANDGGVWKSENSGVTWIDCTSGLITRQYYGIAIDPVHRERVIGGAQDNGTNRRRDIGDDSWDDVLGGDGFECAVNPLVPSIAYATIYNTSIYRSLAGGAARSFVTATPYFGNDENAPFITPLTMRPDTPWVLYTGTDRVWRTENAADSWQPLATTVTDGLWNDVEIWSIAATPADPDVLMVAKGADVYRSDDSGASWTPSPLGAGGLPGKRVIHVEISPFDPDLALASLSGQSAGHLYRTTDGGLTWTQSDSGLPPFSVQVTRWDPTDASVVYAGTDVGLYRSTDAGVSWQAYGQGLPAVSVHDIRVLPDGSMLRVGTHGRGVWELDIPRDANISPSVEITSPASALSLSAGQSASFNATASDADGDAITATWLFTDHWQSSTGGHGQGSLETGASHTFDIGGTYLAAVSIDDGRGGRASAAVTVSVDDPANDCKTPRTIPAAGPFPYEVEISNAAAYRGSDDPSPPCVSDPGDSKAGTWGSMWFEFTPTESHRYSLSTCGSGADSVLTVWTGGTCGPYTAVAGGCNDDDEATHCDGGRTDSYVDVDLDAGTTYRVMIGSYSNSSKGRINLQVACSDCAPPPVERVYLVPAAAHNGGVGGTSWVTDLNLTNPGSKAVSADLAFLPAGGNNAGATEVQVHVPVGGALELPDVVAVTLGANGSGAVRIRSDGDLLVTSRTYNDAPGGTYGQFIPGVVAGAGLEPGQSQLLAGLESDEAYRTNIGVANASDTPAAVTIDLFAADGTALASKDVSLARWGWTQVSGIFAGAGVSDLALGYAVVRNTSTSAVVHTYASVVDARTGDPTYVAAAPSAVPGEPVWIAAAAHTDGVGGSVWRTDVVLTNPLGGDPAAGEDAAVILELHPTSGEPISYAVTVPAGTSVRLGDAVAAAFGGSGAGAIRVVCTQGRVTAVSRTYNQAQNGTYGQFIPGALSGDALASGEDGLLPQLRRTSAFRSNVGFVNLAAETLKVRVDYHRADGSLLGTRHYTVAPNAYFQQTKAVPGTEDVTGVSATVRAETTGARYLAYASVVDNTSGDPVFVPAVRWSE